MPRWRTIARTTALMLLWLVGPGIPPSAAAETTVVEEILDILRDQNDITDAQYQTLRERAQRESALQAEQAAAEALLAAQAAQTPVPAPTPAANSLQAFWKNGLRLTSADKAFDLKLGARIQNDWAVLAPDDDLQDAFSDRAGLGTGTEFRRARIQMSGTIYERLGFKVQYDFADSEVGFRDVFIDLYDLPAVGRLRIGHFKEPLSLEQITSSVNVTFMERSLLDALVPGRETGFMLQNTALEERLTWAIGAFRDTDSDSGNGFSSDPLYSITGRVTGLPWFEDGGRRLLHLGVAFSQRFRDENPVRYASRPEAHLAPNFVNTGNFAADDVQIVNTELALVHGPFSVQGEYNRVFADGSGGSVGDPSFDAFYVQASYFLTGEHRPYKASEGAFDRVVPHQNFDREGGLGAFEVAARFSRIDLDSEGVSGGTLNDGTLGINWYLNPNVRFTFNYVLGRLEGVGWTNQAQSRFQVDF